MNNQLAINITKALGYTENGGKPDLENLKEGKTGELKSIFQYEPTTWKAYAKEVLGNENAPLTPDNETQVTLKKVEDWLGKGFSPEQIFSAWNAGPAEKNAYTGKFSNGHPSKGVNPKYGVQYDVPGYVNKALSYFKKFQSENNQGTTGNTQVGTPVTSNAQVTQNKPSQNPPVQTPPVGLSQIKGLIGQLKPNV